MSESVQFEQLLNEKASLEDKGRQLDEEQRQLKIRANMLAEKIVQELNKKIKAKQEDVKKLHFRINELESQLSSLSVSGVSGVANESVEVRGEVKKETDIFEQEPHETTDEDLVLVTEIAKEIDLSMSSKDKKKRKYF